MIYTQLSKIHRSNEFPLAAGVTMVAEGVAMVGGFTSGVFGVQPSSAATGKFMGFALMQTSAIPAVQTSVIRTERLTTVNSSGDGVVTLQRTPVGKVLARTVSTGVAFSDGDTAESGNTITLTGAGAGVVVDVTYRHALTVEESRNRYGDPKPEGYSGNILRQVGVAQTGIVFTDQFDPAIDWATAATVNLGANGIITSGGAGSAIDAVVVSLPSVEYPYLGLQFNAL